MKKKILYIFISLMVLTCLTGCGEVIENKNEKKVSSISLTKGNVSISCSADDFKYDGIDQMIKTTYNFNEELYAINYEVVTTQKFKKKSLYKTYKNAQEEMIKSTAFDNVSYDLKSDDKTKTLIFTMIVTSINTDIVSIEEKKNFKASEVLKSIESANDATYTCEVQGIDRSKLE